jgi:hypothetical protein
LPLIDDEAANAKASFATRSEQYWNITLGECDFQAGCVFDCGEFSIAADCA